MHPDTFTKIYSVCVYIQSHVCTRWTFIICSCRQHNGGDDDDGDRTPTPFRWLMSSVTFSAPFFSSSWIHMVHFPHSLPFSLYSFPLSHINVMSLTVRVRDNRAAPSRCSLLSFIVCVCHTFRLWCTTAAVYSAFTFISSVELTARVVAWRLQCPMSCRKAIQNDILIYPSRSFYRYNRSHSFLGLNIFDSKLMTTVWWFWF